MAPRREPQELREGLKRVLTDVPLHHGYLEAQAGWSSEAGSFGRVEAGYRPLTNLGVFGFGQVDQFGPMAGLGFRITY